MFGVRKEGVLLTEELSRLAEFASKAKVELVTQHLAGPMVLTDPTLPDNPIVFASRSFTELTGYSEAEIEGKNCRFLQGKETRKEHVERIKELIATGQSGVVRLLNYTKNGLPFMNVFLLVPLFAEGSTTPRLFLGCQCEDESPLRPSPPLAVASGTVPSNLRVRALPNTESLPPNQRPMNFESNFTKGSLLFKTKTDPLDPAVKDYFMSRNRQFEFQVQFELKQPINYETEEVYLGAEIEGELQVGWGTRLIVTTVLTALKLFNKNLHHSYGSGNGRERAHICFPFSVLPDGLIVTKPGDAPPALTMGDLPAGSGEKPSSLHLQVGYTYTLSFYSQYISFEDWVIVKLPGVRSLTLKTFWGNSPLHVVAYTIPKGSNVHDTRVRKVLMDVEVRHVNIDTL